LRRRPGEALPAELAQVPGADNSAEPLSQRPAGLPLTIGLLPYWYDTGLHFVQRRSARQPGYLRGPSRPHANGWS